MSAVLTATNGEAALSRGVQDSPIYDWIFVFQIRDLEAEVFRLLKQNGTQVNNNNNIFERRPSPGEVSKGDTMENVEVRQTSCQDNLSQGWSSLT